MSWRDPENQGVHAGMSYEQFCGDGKTVDAVIRNLEITREAAGFIP